jgi:uncharacterized protein YabE (DUF348 family)
LANRPTTAVRTHPQTLSDLIGEAGTTAFVGDLHELAEANLTHVHRTANVAQRQAKHDPQRPFD